ncbi:MAG: hypothetical protein ACI4ND_05605 [Succinivibrio sp.]
MLKAKRNVPMSQRDPYYCANQLKELIEHSNISPIIAMVVYDFLKEIVKGQISYDNVYSRIEQLFEERLKMCVLNSYSSNDIRSRTRAYMVIMLELVCHADLVEGVDVDLQALKEFDECSVNVRIIPNGLAVTKRGLDYIENYENIFLESQKGDKLLSALRKCTFDELRYIIERYRTEPDFEDSDVIIIDKVQA